VLVSDLPAVATEDIGALVEHLNRYDSPGKTLPERKKTARSPANARFRCLPPVYPGA
jgi:hypothetical protein